jgi:hypothetical protein
MIALMVSPLNVRFVFDAVTLERDPSAVIPGRPEGPGSESITTTQEYGFRARASKSALADLDTLDTDLG